MLIVLVVLSIVMVILVFAALVHHSYWIFKALEFPRLQKLFLILFLMLCWIVFWQITGEISWWAFGSLVACVAYLLYKIIPYTILFPKELKDVANKNGRGEIKVFTANVYQYNTEYEKMIQQVRECDPDVVFLLETDKVWSKAMAPLKQDYPNILEEPLDNTYGLVFMTRLKIVKGEVAFLASREVPSIDAVLELASGEQVKVWGLHPKPPVPQESITTDQQDKELMKVALKAEKEKLPVLVFGDLNDVAWSYTTILFKKVSCLLDPRRGRGFYNTFSANHRFMRFPLDYLFCSKHFGMVEMRRFGHNGSDHFPIFIHLALVPGIDNEQHLVADGDDVSDAKEMASK